MQPSGPERTGGASAPASASMALRILLPTEVLLELDVVKVVAEAENGSFGLLPRHVDFVAALRPGLLSFTTVQGVTRYAAVDRGVLVKCGRSVRVSTFDAAVGEHLAALRQLVEARFMELDESERRARTALSRLEAAALRGLREIQAPGG